MSFYLALNHTVSAAMNSFRSTLCWCVVVELELTDTFMVCSGNTNTPLVCYSRIGTNWYFHGICSGTHCTVISMIFRESIIFFLHSLLSHSLWFVVKCQRRLTMHFAFPNQNLKLLFFLFFCVHYFTSLWFCYCATSGLWQFIICLLGFLF